MSIFKKSFKPFVKEQITKRQTKANQGDRTYFLQRQCVIRMASGVNDENGPTTAKNNILEGGTRTLNSNREGFKNSYDKPNDGFGTVPMPGIINAEIKTLTAYGSLRGATVKFECHSTKQLSLMEKLYMRPGYPCLLEWGWDPYLVNNEETLGNNLVYLSSDKKFWDGTWDQREIEKLIVKRKKLYDGNYDGLYGIVKNFNYSVRPDGGYTCTTELIAIGEVIQSLKGRLSEDDETKSELEKTLEDLNEFALSLSERGLDFTEKLELSYNMSGGDTFKTIKNLTNSSIIDESIKTSRKLKQDEFYKKYPDLGLIKQESFLDEDRNPNIWIKWGDLIPVINNSIPKDNSLLSLIEIDHDDLEFNLNIIGDDLNLETKTGKQLITTNQKNLSLSINPNICLFPQNMSKLFSSVGDLNSSAGYPKPDSRKISDICFEVTYLLNSFRSLYYTIGENDEKNINENFSLGKFIKKIWDDVNNSCGSGHNFEINNDNEQTHKIRIIDLAFQGENINSSNLATLNVLDTKSFVRDFSYDLSIPSALISTIAIAAQNPDDPESLEEVTFAAFNKGIKNRFVKSKSNNTEETGNKKKETTLQKKQRRFKEFRTSLEIYLLRLKGPRDVNLDPPTDTIYDSTGNITADAMGKYNYINTLNSATNYNRSIDDNNSKDSKIRLAGAAYNDINEIPSSDLSSAKNILRYLNSTRTNLEYLKNKTNNPTSIIPIQYNAKLDGLSGIVIGNLFKIDKSRLPELYKKNNVAFIVTTENQSISGQDWTTTITGQAVILPV